MFNAFVKVIPNFYSCKANVEFIIVCFDGVDVIGWFRSKPGIVWVYGCYCLKKIFKGRWKKIIVIVIHDECIMKVNKISKKKNLHTIFLKLKWIKINIRILALDRDELEFIKFS